MDDLARRITIALSHTKPLNNGRPELAWRQWIDDCRAVAIALGLHGEDQLEFLRYCGLDE